MNSQIESGLELVMRLTQRPNLENINPILIPKGPYPNEFVEIVGAPGTGKTTVLMDFIVRTLLPLNLLGKNCGTVLIDTDHKFDMLRLITMLECELKKLNVAKSCIHSAIMKCLKNLTVLNCYDNEQLQMSFYNLEQILIENSDIGLIAVDCIPAYYWQYRNLSDNHISVYGYTKQMLQCLEQCVRNNNIVVAYTRNAEADVKEIKLGETIHRILLKKEAGSFNAFVNDKLVPYTLGKTISWL
ncbi:hypothetical protein RN001_010420 [Aquatica leii]|uniref:RecA family profile 1 domain-containing protein n=1 Tax=Aquatica leii TaxID=1421715 RepID=A0AAN7P6F8_9COLE|nr:hypothetical protein RN001_010420 [Aquatica leii]